MTFPELLDDYFSRWPGESGLQRHYRALLGIENAFYRSGRPGHFTASALIMDEKRTRTLLVEHRKLGIWVQPGGHADGDEDLERAAGKEVTEETGLRNWSCDGIILDLDIHPIPARKDEGPHDHYDVRFLFIADPAQSIAVSEESTDLQWIAVRDILDYTDEESMLRMLRKAGALQPILRRGRPPQMRNPHP